jgi:hypothetical protein
VTQSCKKVAAVLLPLTAIEEPWALADSASYGAFPTAITWHTRQIWAPEPVQQSVAETCIGMDWIITSVPDHSITLSIAQYPLGNPQPATVPVVCNNSTTGPGLLHTETSRLPRLPSS